MSKPLLPDELARLGYSWEKVSPPEVGQMVTEALVSVNAECWVLDVYASNKLYRSIEIHYNGFFSKKKVKIMYAEEDARGISIQTLEE